MADNVKDKKFYWIKLKQSLLTSEKVDYLMSQKDGANYVVLYQCLCLKTVNSAGELANKVGELIMPFDENKIQRECKWFSLDTIRVAMTLYQKLGLIYEQENGILKIKDFEELVGGETYWADRKRLERRENKQIGQPLDNVQLALISNIYNSNIYNNYNFSNKVKKYIELWLSYKKEKKQSYKETGLKTLFNSIQKNIEDYGEEYVIDGIENSMANNWQGIYYANKTTNKVAKKLSDHDYLIQKGYSEEYLDSLTNEQMMLLRERNENL